MKLLLDEQFAPDIAVQLRQAGHDVVAVREQTGLASSDDEPLLEWAAVERRALVTNNVRDFAPIARGWGAEGRRHHGLIFTSDESLPRARSTIGRHVRALAALLDAHPADDALVDQVRWLAPA